MDADITLPDGWKPIGATKDGRVNLQKGANLNAFSGIFDGAGHTITVPEGGLPLFGYVRNTRIRNLNIYGKKIAGYGLVNNFEGVGLSGSAVEIDNVTLKSGSSTLKSGLLGANKTVNGYAGCSAAFVATITNCTIEKGVVVGYDKKQSQIGAIAGRMQGTIKNCVSYADVYGTDYVGGIIGTRDNAMGTCEVIGSEFYGTVTASGQHKLFSTEGLRITVDSLEISGDYRTAFDIGEDLDFTGMQVKALISDGTEQEVPWTDLTIEGYNKNQRGEQTLKLSYG
ncbi:MAG: bacterial Ig-like domain-containing protein [Blautia faecis]